MRLSDTLKPVETGVIFKSDSSDSKLSRDRDVAVTLVAQDSCPTDCPFFPKDNETLREGKAGSCYANVGNMNVHAYRLNSTGPHDPDELAQEEARLIRAASGNRPLRLHTVGDTKTLKGVEVVSAACEEYTGKRGMKVWTYTHAHHIPRRAWRSVSVLRSCHAMGQVKRAHLAGYAAAMTVDHFPAGAKKWTEDGITFQPCPNQTAGYRQAGKKTTGPKVTCDDCRLCWDDQKLLEEKKVIVFALHGWGITNPANRQAFDMNLVELAKREPNSA